MGPEWQKKKRKLELGLAGDGSRTQGRTQAGRTPEAGVTWSVSRTSASVRGDAAEHRRRSSEERSSFRDPAQVAGGIVTIVIGIVLYIVSVNGVVITLTATISGVLAGSLVARGLELHWRRRSQRSLRVNSTPIALLAVSRTAKPGHRSSSRKRIRTLR
jgi:hypothetical protein